MEHIFMIRGGMGAGSFGTDFNMKIYMVVATLVMCIYDWRKNGRKDYFWVFLVGWGIWTLAELFLQVSGRRVMMHRYLFGMDLPLWLSIPIQGAAEGGTVAIIGIFIGDRLSWKRTRTAAALLAAVLAALLIWSSLRGGIQAPNVGGEVPSRRDMFMPVPLIFLAFMVYIDIRFFLKATTGQRARGLYMLGVMIVLSAFWTLGEWMAGTRWIEVGTPDNLRRAPGMVEFAALSFDVIVEIALAYLPFFALPCRWGLIGDSDDVPEEKT